MKIVAIIQARMGSTRFPGKVMADLCGKPVLQHVIERVQEAKGVDEVVVACPCDELEAHKIVFGLRDAGHGDVKIYFPQEDENDVLERFFVVAQDTNADWIIRVCGDNPLIDPRGIEELVNCAVSTQGDLDTTAYISHHNRGVPIIKYPTGYFAEAINRGELESLSLDTIDPRREHVTQAMYENPDEFICKWLKLPDWYTADIPNASIDTPEDLERVRAMMEAEHAPAN